MEQVTFRAMVDRLGIAVPDTERFWSLGDVTGLRRDPETGAYFRSNYERGPLLYSLVAHYRPKRVIEFGTGRGYGSLSMAWAMADHGIDGEIVTVDIVGMDQPIKWDIDQHDGRGARTEKLTRNAIWPTIAEPAWLKHVRTLTGNAAEIMASFKDPVDFAFIDGAHWYEGVRHDFFSVVPLVDGPLGILFDDYHSLPREGLGVKSLIEQHVAPHFSCSELENDGTWCGAAASDYPSVGHAMLFARREAAAGPLAAAYPEAQRRGYVSSYRRSERIKGVLRKVKRALRV